MKEYLLSLVTGFLVLTTSGPYDGTIWNNPPRSLPPGVTHHTFHSDSVSADVGFNVYLPPDYDADASRRYPVIYFLHGRTGDENAELANFGAFVKSSPPPNAIIVFPNGGRNSKYLDAVSGSRMHGRVMAETMITRELIPYIDRRYRTRPEAASRAIQGFSMGGMGALRLAFKHPDQFGSVYAFAPALDDTADNLPENEGELLRYMLNGDVEIWRAEMAATQLAQHAGEIRHSGMRINLSVGADDDLLPWVRNLSTKLNELHIPHGFDVIANRPHAYAFGPNFEAVENVREKQPD